jgi:hypothetical protein
MLYCEPCRQQKNWRRPTTYPYHREYKANCEICNKRTDCYDYPALFAKLESEKTLEEKVLDKRLQEEYKSKAESLVITRVRGPYAGRIDDAATEYMKGAVVRNNGEIDWYATYELRVRIQEGYGLVERR